MTAGLAALALLTRVPVRQPHTPSEIAQATVFFPIVGTFIGGAQVALLLLLESRLPPSVLSVCLVAAAALLTGALHLDGLADTADGFGAGRSREHVLQIMRDSAIGAYGATTLLLVVIARTNALTTLIERRAAIPFLLLAPTLSRWSMVGLGHALPYARSGAGLGAVIADVTRRRLAVATVIGAAVTLSINARYAIASWAVTLGVTVAFGWLCHRRIGGFTGDALGANGELTETAVIFAGVVLAG
jgi:adenosylcobinamide-GDP ribazoletransferase